MTFEGPLGYRAVAALCRFLLRLFYKRIDLVGLENVPSQGALLVAANHHNSVVDAMLLVAFLPRRLRALANAPLFKHPVMGPFLKVMGALPVHRRQEAGNDPSRNTALFDATTQALTTGGAIMIFPEGRTQPEPVLLELRTGAARMFLAAQHARQGAITFLPVGLLFQAPGTFREGQALILVGAPIETEDCRALAQTDSERAARELTDRLRDSLKALLVEADDRSTLELLIDLERLWRDTGGDAGDARQRVTWLQKAARTYGRLRQERPEYAEALRKRVAENGETVRDLGIEGGPVREGVSLVSRVASIAALGLTVPFALTGLLMHVVPYKLLGAVVARIPHTAEEDATDKIVGGALLFPLMWALEGVAVFRLWGMSLLLLFLALLLPLGFFTLVWRERFDQVVKEWRARVRLKAQPNAVTSIVEARAALLRELTEIAQAHPEIWSQP